MKKIYLLIMLCWLIGRDGVAKHVPAVNAQTVAKNFLHKVALKDIAGVNLNDLKLVHQETAQENTITSPHIPLTYYYVFTVKNKGGLIFVSANDKVNPILGYTATGSYDPANMPPNLVKWLEGYKNEIRFAEARTLENEQVKLAWKDLLEGNKINTSSFSTMDLQVAPLLSTTWNQSPYYNDLCPYDNTARERAVTGCGATAMGQVMKYWEYPAKGSGFHSYNHQKYGTLSANFSNITFEWDKMPNNVTGPNQPVAALMQALGVSVEMAYNVASAGGSYTYLLSGGVTNSMEYAMKTYFGYQDVIGVRKDNYTWNEWTNLLKTELDASRPVLYLGSGDGGGHIFVCDGYDANNMFHMNWGWGGAYDGYFAITALNPGGVGTGGGTGGYNNIHLALINIKAPVAPKQSSDLQLYDHVTLNNNSIDYGAGFNVHTNIINNGTSTFKGDYGAAAFDENGNFIDFIKTYSNNELPAGYSYKDGINFTTEGLASLLPGTYNIYVFYKSEGGQWEQLKGESFTDRVTLKVVNYNSIDLAAALNVQNINELYQGRAVSVNITVKNKGAAAYSGWLDISLYNLDGTFVYGIAQQELIQLCAGCNSVPLTFSNPKLDVVPGTYLLAMAYTNAENTWALTGSSQYINPIKVVVKEAPLGGDTYEDNDEVAKSFNLPLTLAGKTGRLTTPGATIHVGADYDYYKLSLPAGFNYEITARVHDSYNAGDNLTYTNDVIFSLSDDGTNWSDAYDDLMPAAVQVEGGKTIYAYVSPYFQGKTGTYLLDINVRQLQPTGIGDELAELEVDAYPNPTANILYLKTKKGVESYELTSITGKLIMQAPKNTTQLNLAHLTNGIYLLRTKLKEGYQVQKIIKK